MKTIYHNGTVITMEGDQVVTALLVENGRIAAVGGDAEILAQKDGQTSVIDLQGKTLLPAFIDPHSHITAMAQTLGLCDLSGADSFEEIARRLKAYREQRGLKPGEWVLGFGYDQNILKEKRQPDKTLLDAALPENPSSIVHASGHMGALSSLALKETGITADTPEVEGGVIGRMPGGKEPSGYLEEAAFMQYAGAVLQPKPEQLVKQLKEAEQVYLRHGVTTIQDGITKAGEAALLVQAAENHVFDADVVSYVDLKDNRDLLKKYSQYAAGYRNGLRFGGYKIFLDGSPQGRTAWMSQPYEGAEDGYCGYPVYQDDQVTRFAEEAIGDGRQLLTHCNGDAAADQLLRCYGTAVDKLHAGAELRPVMIHAQTVRKDQLDAMKPLGMIPSFFVAHVYQWGDVHIQNFGERAQHISPAKSAWERGIPFTFHQDSPVLPPDMLHTVWAAVNRITMAGVLLGPEERLTPMEALRAVTINAAYQYFEEDEKGSLRPGKRADLVILDRDPLTVDPMTIQDVQVLETIKDGRTVYARPQ